MSYCSLSVCVGFDFIYLKKKIQDTEAGSKKQK